MKNIKSKKVFESLEDSYPITQDIRDILLEFSDFDIEVDIKEWIKDDMIYIIIGSGDGVTKFFLDDEKKDALIRIISISKGEWIYKSAYCAIGYSERPLFIHEDKKGVISNNPLLWKGMDYIKLSLRKR